MESGPAAGTRAGESGDDPHHVRIEFPPPCIVPLVVLVSGGLPVSVTTGGSWLAALYWCEFPVTAMDAVYPSSASALARGRRLRRADPRQRHHTTPVTFAEIKEVDEENEEVRLEEHAAARGEVRGEAGEARRRRPDLLEERLGQYSCPLRSKDHGCSKYRVRFGPSIRIR
ncbi:hypothetical protein O3G_MSEX012312 [Manduca sexta]|uniref:Uncharacterized protein n=1 Tax=Manduca sexta TaxID=7130 RepID=A0A922CWG3_MANSE|nr:hypothetical protein O3G_MSEX012312 [Manduca sexta]